MELNAVDLMAFMLFSQIAMAALVLYSFVVQERESRRRTETVVSHLERLLAELEKRTASGTFRTADELDRVIAATAQQTRTSALMHTRTQASRSSS
jgi:hypothetical protein